MSRTWGRQRDQGPPNDPPNGSETRMASGVAHARTDFVPMLTTADGPGVGSPRSGRCAPSERAPGDGAGGRRAGSFRRDDKGGDEVRKRSWIWRLAAVVAALALALGLAACGGDDDDSGAASDTTGGGGTTLDVAYVTVQQHPYGIAVDSFIKAVDGTGQLTLNAQPVYPQSEIQLLDDVRSGVVPMATISSAIWDTAGITAFQALQAPFLITNYPLAEAVEGGDIGKSMLADATEQAGDVVALAIHEGGLRKPFGAEKKLVSVDSFQGTTIRAPQSQVLAAGFQALGANVEPLPLPDVYQALQNGTVDGVEANLPLIYTQKWYEVGKYVTGNVNFWPF